MSLSSRIPGPIGMVLNQAPPAGPLDGGVRPAMPNRAPLNRKESPAAARVVRSVRAAQGFDCVRGETVTLEATGATVAARQFEWTFSAGVPVIATGRLYTEENPPPARMLTGRKDGKTVSVVALAPFRATLVARGATSASAPVEIDVRVQPRPWKTPFNQRPQFQTFSKFYGAHALLEKHAGENACAFCGSDLEYGHWIHRSRGRLDWKEQVRVAQVKDPGGPFDGLWYVERADLKVERGLYINGELTEGQVFKLNNKKGVKAEYREGLNARIDCTKQHERLHGELARKKLAEPGMDPAPHVEPLIGEDEASLVEQANTEIALKEDKLNDATTGPEGHGALREQLAKKLKTTRVTFLLPQSQSDTEGIPVETDLLGFSD